jgi:bifunctional UDP-N-acetylglucosamine pyrophosphorylase/glucosamine-1-phosphate N-acetyltransferase
VLQQLAGRTLLSWVLQAANVLNPKTIHVVCGHKADELQAAFSNERINWVLQKEQLGTGHAVAECLPFLAKDSQVLVLSGDVPLLSSLTLERLAEKAEHYQMTLITAKLGKPDGLGRVIRDKDGRLLAIREEKDASAEETLIQEIYSGVMLANADFLQRKVPKLSNDNAQKEYYLTELIEMCRHDGAEIGSVQPLETIEIEGVNDLVQLESLERLVHKREAIRLMKQGVRILDAARVDFRGQLEAASDVEIDSNTLFEGKVILEENVKIGPNCVIKDAHLKEGVEVYANTLIEGAVIEKKAKVGPFARIRPGTELGEGAKVGNFVEMKKTKLGKGSKANHLSYVGDCITGDKVNIGAGTITCNYDGVNKHQTMIEDEAFVGSGTQLVAPVRVGKGATIGAGTTLRQEAPDNKLTLSLKRCKTVDGWQRPKKKE